MGIIGLIMGAAKRASKADTKERRKDASDRKEDQIRIRVTTEQKTILTEAATKAGLGVSGWLLSVGLREARALERE